MQNPTIAQIEFERTERIEKVLEAAMKCGHEICQTYIAGYLPFRSYCNGRVGHGDSRREADAQLASKLSLPSE